MKENGLVIRVFPDGTDGLNAYFTMSGAVSRGAGLARPKRHEDGVGHTNVCEGRIAKDRGNSKEIFRVS